MKIGIITLYYKNNNYGGVAQAYALNKYLTNLGFESELISYKLGGSKLNLIDNNYNYKMIFSRCCNKAKKTLKAPIEKLLEKKYIIKLRERENKLEEFRQQIPHSKLYNINNIGNIENRYDIFITGSDQTWNPGVIDNAFVFSFLKNKHKKIFSYASSVAVTNASVRYINFMKDELEKYSFISVREEQSKKILQQTTNKKINWVIDPTLLLERNDWEKITGKRIVKEKYILCYMLGDSIKQREVIKKFAKKMGLKLVTIPYIVNGNKFKFKLEDFKFGNEQMIDISFNDFLSLIKYADYVITDSFHAVCFSYIYKKEFYVFEKKTLVSTSSRIYSLLKLFGTTNRIVNKSVRIQQNKLEYDKIDKNIHDFIEESKEYINEALDYFKNKFN